jgi:hypothetical protein
MTTKLVTGATPHRDSVNLEKISVICLRGEAYALGAASRAATGVPERMSTA